MDKILFIIPPNITFQQFIKPAYNERLVHKQSGDFGSALTDMPLGALSMSAYLKKHTAAETRLINFNVVLNKLAGFPYGSYAEFFKAYLSSAEIKDYAPAIISLSALFTPAYRSLLDLAACCREIFPRAVIVAGGGVPTNMYQEIFRDSGDFDALCYGEGEKPLLELALAADRPGYLKENSSWITREKLNRGQAFRHNFITDLDEIPFYDYALLDADEYGLNPAIMAYASLEEKKQNFHVMTSRGCAHRCCFCSSHTVHGRQMRYHSLARIKEDFTRLVNEFGAKTLVFQDDNFMADRRRAFAIIEILKELKITAVFQSGLAMYALDRKMLEALKGAGVEQIVLSIESGSNRVLEKIMHKPINLEIVKRVAADCRRLGIYTNANILIGLPGETKEDLQDARAFLKTVMANWFIILCATPLAGSEMLDICLKKNYLKVNYIDCDFKKAVVETENFTAEYIQETAYSLNLELNFVENSDWRLGDYKTALKGLENAIRAKNDHAFAYYYAGECYRKLGDLEKAERYLAQAKAIVAGSQFWRDYAAKFNLPL